MAGWITASAGDTLCGIAAQNGFVNCDPLRNHPDNAGLRDRQVQAGDRVFVPDIVEAEEDGETERRHRFVRHGVPLASIRYVHGSPDRPAADDPETAVLNVSNYRTDRAGTNGTNAFPPTNHWRFDQHAHADPDAFKVEVRDARPGNTATQVDVILEALHPLYIFGGEVSTVDHYVRGRPLAINWDGNWSSAAEGNRRRLTLQVHRAAAAPDQRFRSAYLRLVTDEADKAARPQQTLLVTDDQANEERVEILDQRIRATYILQGCPAAADARCRVTTEAPVGDNNRRVRMCVGIFRQNIGDATGYNGCTIQDVRFRVFKWFRRVYAQANIAPKIVEPGIRYLDPPSRNMLTVSDLHGQPARGGLPLTQISFQLTATRPDGTSVTKDVAYTIPDGATEADRRPIGLANHLVAAINDADFRARSFENPWAIHRNPARRSADVVIEDNLGGRVNISRTPGRMVLENDSRASLHIAPVRLDRFRNADGVDVEFGSMDERLIMHNFDSDQPNMDRLDCYVIGRFSDPGLRARAFAACYDLNPSFQPGAPFPFSIFLATRSTSGAVVDSSDNLPFTFAHEAGHVLLDCFHANPRSELMARGTSGSATVRGTKRICDTPVQVGYGNYRAGTTTPGIFQYAAATRLQTFATNQMAALFEAW